MKIKEKLSVKSFSKKDELYSYIAKLLTQNKSIWQSYGPESDEAIQNPFSNLYIIWELRKIQDIIPNNLKIVNALKNSFDLMSQSEYNIACQFIEHAAGFEIRTYEIIEGVPRFPVEFERMIFENV